MLMFGFFPVIDVFYYCCYGFDDWVLVTTKIDGILFIIIIIIVIKKRFI